MPYDDRSNYEKGSTEELGQWYTTTLRKRQLRGEASLSLIEDPRPRLQAHFFQSSSVTRIVATQHNKTQLPAVATVGLSLFQTTYCFTSPAICGDGFRCWKPTKLREGHEDQHCNTELGNKKNIRNSQQWQPICISVRGLLVFRWHCLPCLTSQILQSPF